MGEWIIEQMVLEFAKRSIPIGGANVLVLGFTFKENCPDFRNSKVLTIIETLNKYSINTVVVDPWVDTDKCFNDLGINVSNSIPSNRVFDGVVSAVSHSEYENFTEADWKKLIVDNGVLVDIKGIIPRSLSALRI